MSTQIRILFLFVFAVFCTMIHSQVIVDTLATDINERDAEAHAVSNPIAKEVAIVYKVCPTDSGYTTHVSCSSRIIP